MKTAVRCLFCPSSILQQSAQCLRNPVRSKSVYGCGLTASGSLATSKNPSIPLELCKPTRISYCDSKDIKCIAAGFGFSLFASNDKIYGCGIDIFSNDVDSENIWKRGRRLMLGKDFNESIIDVAAGRRHFLVATNKKLYAFGDNAHGQCGHDPDKYPFLIPNDKKVRSVSIPSDSPIAKVHCTLDTSFVLLESGEVFSFGLGTDGQLGRGVVSFDWKCASVEGDLKNGRVLSLGGSTDTLLAVTRDGYLFMWGQNEYSQMSPFSDEMQVGYPCEIRLSIGKIRSARSTATSCIVLTRDGKVFVWGFGVLGQGPVITSLSKPAQLEPNLFSGKPGDNGSVKKIFAGNTSMFAISEEENLFAWGVNRYSHLGLETDKDQFFPFQVCLPKQPYRVAVAPDHTLFLLR